MEKRDLAIAVIEDDPLAVKLTDAERRRRLVALLDARSRVDRGVSKPGRRRFSSDSGSGSTGCNELTAVDAQFPVGSHLNAGETLDAAFDTIVSTGEAAASCAASRSKHRVLSLIRRLHQGQRR